MRVLVAMSGGVDSSVAAALLIEQGHEVVGATMKLWGGDSDSGCCSVADVDDARRVAQQLGIVHRVFSFGDDFLAHVVEPYVAAHAAGRTPNPCVECNRHLKFDRFVRRADQLGFDAIATGHHARVVDGELRRGADRAKDQSYVLHMLGPDVLARTLLPVGEFTKDEVRAHAARLGLRTADKPDSQDVCFITSTGGRSSFLGARIPLRPGRFVEHGTGADLGPVASVELMTVGQRRGLGNVASAPDGTRRFVLSVDPAGGMVEVGPLSALLVDSVVLSDVTWTSSAGPPPHGAAVLVQASAHGEVMDGAWDGPSGAVRFAAPQKRVAAGQSVVLYDLDDDCVLGGGTAA